MKYAGSLALVVCMVSALHAQTQNTQKKLPAGSDPETPTSAKGGTNPNVIATEPDYRIGPMDVLRIDVWKEPDISRVAPVRPDGKISLPLLNDIQAAGLTTMQLSAVIAAGLKEYITNPQVTVSLSEMNSRRVYVTGEVTHPGALPLLPSMTVLQALSSTGGFTQFARLSSIYVLRTASGKKVKYPFDYKDVVAGKKQGQDIELQPGDVVVVP